MGQGGQVQGDEGQGDEGQGGQGQGIEGQGGEEKGITSKGSEGQGGQIQGIEVKGKAVKVAKCKKDKAAAEQEGKQEYAAVQKAKQEEAAAAGAVSAATKCNKNTGGRCRLGASCYSWRKATCDNNSYCVCGSKCVVKGSQGNMCVDKLGPANKQLTSASTQLDIAQGKLKAA